MRNIGKLTKQKKVLFTHDPQKKQLIVDNDKEFYVLEEKSNALYYIDKKSQYYTEIKKECDSLQENLFNASYNFDYKKIFEKYINLDNQPPNH